MQFSRFVRFDNLLLLLQLLQLAKLSNFLTFCQLTGNQKITFFFFNELGTV